MDKFLTYSSIYSDFITVLFMFIIYYIFKSIRYNI